jgi:hypothetical protein
MAMQWDHISEESKSGNVADIVRRHDRRRVLEEIEKCELVCANWHAVRTLGTAGA